MSFTEHFGNVQYARVIKKPAAWRTRCLARYYCEFTGCRGDGAVVFDHCHRHGWIRGVLCKGCNIRLGHLEAVMSIDGVTVDLGSTGYARFLASLASGRRAWVYAR